MSETIDMQGAFNPAALKHCLENGGFSCDTCPWEPGEICFISKQTAKEYRNVINAVLDNLQDDIEAHTVASIRFESMREYNAHSNACQHALNTIYKLREDMK